MYDGDEVMMGGGDGAEGEACSQNKERRALRQGLCHLTEWPARMKAAAPRLKWHRQSHLLGHMLWLSGCVAVWLCDHVTM